MIRLEPEEAILFLDSRTSDEVVLNDPPKMVHRSTDKLLHYILEDALINIA